MHLPVFVTLVVYVLAAMRATGLITADQLTAALRARVIEWLWLTPDSAADPTGWRKYGTYLLTCSWCVSIYVGAVAAVVWYTVGNNPVLFVIALALAFSQVTGMLSDVGRG